MNYLAIALFALVAVTAALTAPPVDHTPPVPIVKLSHTGPSPDGSYSYSYETGNGIQAEEEGHLNHAGTDEEAIEARGSFSYTGDDGQVYQVTYVANENGFQPEGAHLPQVPPLIQKALKYIAEHPEENDSH
ncbi:flexible cuticle protein 12 [Harpegnathos saltator]|uniref:Endocuticle structural glycoprotein SgAbd-8 n=1 Tax=Harpegnathos saltator TaxID=610380 RepID=E2BGZ5_HARSA|nr:flexible cuticle protein 12 [Harpegnathos saltator]EFN85028.1 Endocuticle structural glycoprotein SgAbd-8 [Harpegnathos saltator]